MLSALVASVVLSQAPNVFPAEWEPAKASVPAQAPSVFPEAITEAAPEEQAAPEEPPKKAAVKPTLAIISMPGCAPCKVMKQRLNGLDKTKVTYIEEDFRKWNAKQTDDSLKVYTAPTIFIWASDGKFYKVVGLISLKRVEDALFAKKSEQTAAHSVKIRGTGRGRWTWPGMPSVRALEQHLRGSPHNIDYTTLQSMTDRQLINLHDSLHSSRSVQTYKPRGARRVG